MNREILNQRLTIYTVQSVFGFGSPGRLIQAEKNAISRAECVTGQMQAKLCLESSVMDELGNFKSTPYYLHCTISFWFCSPGRLIQAEKNAISRAECVTGQMQAKLCLESSVMNESGNFKSTPYYLHCTIRFWF